MSSMAKKMNLPTSAKKKVMSGAVKRVGSAKKPKGLMY